MARTVKHLVIYCDSCGGQNRSIKTVLLLRLLLHRCAHLESITIRYFESGHSYNSCDTNFGKIEQKLKIRDGLIFDFMDLVEAILVSQVDPRTPVVKLMLQDDFVELGDSLHKIVNRKKDIEGEKLNWLQMHEIELLKETPHIIGFKYKLDDEIRYLDIAKYETVAVDGSNKKMPIPLSRMAIQRTKTNVFRPINVEKREDLLKMRDSYLPPDKKTFWEFLDICETSIEPESFESLVQPKLWSDISDGEKDEEPDDENDDE